jgi:hypothetical protein
MKFVGFVDNSKIQNFLIASSFTSSLSPQIYLYDYICRKLTSGYEQQKKFDILYQTLASYEYLDYMKKFGV